jgi:hypothetical protein
MLRGRKNASGGGMGAADFTLASDNRREDWEEGDPIWGSSALLGVTCSDGWS